MTSKRPTPLAYALLAFAPELRQQNDAGWHWDGGEKVDISHEKMAEQLESVRSGRLAIDNDFNVNGIRRFALPLCAEGNLIGILAVAQRQSPRADRETEFYPPNTQKP